MENEKSFVNQKRTPPNSKQEVILYRLDGIEQQLSEVKELLVQTALQEQRLTNLESAYKAHEQEKEQIIALKNEVETLKTTIQTMQENKKQSNDKWWQILLMCLSPLASALIVWIISGGLK